MGANTMTIPTVEPGSISIEQDGADLFLLLLTLDANLGLNRAVKTQAQEESPSRSLPMAAATIRAPT
jgi:hypothetical protein